ncbi:MAG: hypothetical protein EOO00_00095 [Chitinophagaceae bacterium]|nr:MAG: hypothetical protein EOO00_00095 [Chitinophagaceae bacterium]
MRTLLNNEKVRVLLLSALVIALLLAMPRLVLILYIKYNSGGYLSRMNDVGSGFLLKLTYSFIIAVLFLVINTGRKKFLLGSFRVDFTKFPHRMIVNLIVFAILRGAGAIFTVNEPGMPVLQKFNNFIFTISLVMEIILCILVAEIYMLMIKNQSILLRNHALQRSNVESTFEVLKNQVNPHFLFNSLNTINAMIGSTNERAKAFVNNMSQVYRHVLSSSRKDVVPVEDELEVAIAYIDMLRERHGDTLKIEIKKETKLSGRLLPPMSLQILLENAVKHNVVSLKHPLLISIVISEDGITVSNTSQEKKIKPPSTGTGLYNLSQRYKYLCDKEITIIRTDLVFKVSLPLLVAEEVNTSVPVYHSV